MKFLKFLVPLIFLISCESTPEYKYYCSIQNQEERAMFVENCLEKTSWQTGVTTCTDQAERIYCVYTNSPINARIYYLFIEENMQHVPDYEEEQGEEEEPTKKEVIFSWLNISNVKNLIAPVVEKTTYH